MEAAHIWNKLSLSEGNFFRLRWQEAFLKPMNITETSRKDEVITSACELFDQPEAVIRDLTDKKNTLIFLVSLVLIIHILSWTLKTK